MKIRKKCSDVPKISNERRRKIIESTKDKSLDRCFIGFCGSILKNLSIKSFEEKLNNVYDRDPKEERTIGEYSLEGAC